MVRNKLKNMALSIAVLMGLGMASPVFAKSDYNPGDILALGSDLTDAQEAALRKYFNAPDGTNTIYVTDEVIIKQLGLDPNDPANYAGGCYSSAYVKLLDDNSGINVKATNLTEVTESMLMNALITSGITAADVKVSSPFKVTGTSALSGILAGVEEVGGFEISLKQKETAQKEIETTVEVGDEIGSEEASTIINDIKTEVIKEQPKTEEEIKKIVENITNQYNVNISINAKDSIVNLMSHVNDLGLDYSELKSSLKEASNKLSNNLKELGIKLKEEGFFEKIKNWFVDLWDKFINLFRSNDNNEEESKENAPLDFNQEPIKEQSDDENQNLEEEIRPVDDTQIGDTITEDSVNDENVNEDTTTSEEKQVSDDTNTNSSTMDSETITN
ncbi:MULTISPECIES: DUF1002 domain-containing protein [Clostridia]|uniref:DUF1002 domain-containing protein n=2 Tax=Clostridia TaxID=186801 RepID=A0A8I0ACA1_9CLOT|nr:MULTISPECIES: DUF1002 domain-containing protein [Clostridia]MBC5639080.1 DUF1002 domain-containing protein [Clostridium lentum]MBC5653173.1 DUF1002 domain-containing protein [Blautia lenta]MEE0568274.1 DUF1002 domain-containing protein [Clostridium sp.]CDB75928.1 putative uncharacterized protein [Clostridium sp. CAG:265]